MGIFSLYQQNEKLWNLTYQPKNYSLELLSLQLRKTKY